MRFPFFRNRDSVKNGILISIRRTGDGFHPGLFNNSPIDLKNQLLSVISQMQSVSHLFVETGKDFSRKRKNFFLRYHSVSLIYGREYHSERMVRFLGFFSGYGFGSRLLPATSEIVA